MYPSVRDAWLDFTKPLEGGVPWPYLDILGLVTIAYGNLIDSSKGMINGKPDPMPWRAALALPLVKPDGSPASAQEITDAWRAVKGQQQLAQQGYRAAARWSTLRLTDDGMAQVALAKFDIFDTELHRRFPEIDEWPADAQLATMSMAWACGAWFVFPRLVLSLHDKDFARAAQECHMNETGNAGLIPRNKANKQLYMNAQRARDWKLDPTELRWPRVLEDSVPTEPELPETEDDPIVHPDVEFPERKVEE